MPTMNTTWSPRAGLPKGYVIDPTTGQLVPGANQSVPTVGGSTNFETLSKRPAWEQVPMQPGSREVLMPGEPGYGAGSRQVLMPGEPGYGEGWPSYEETIANLDAIVRERGERDPLARQANELKHALQRNPEILGTGDFQGAMERMERSIVMAEGANPSQVEALARSMEDVQKKGVGTPQRGVHPDVLAANKGTPPMAAPGTGGASAFGGAPQPGSPSFDFDNQNDWWQTALKGGVEQADTDYGAMVDRQKGFDDQAINSLNDLYNTQKTNAANYNKMSADLFGGYASAMGGYNAQDQGALDHYLGEYDQNRARVEGMRYDPVAFDPQGLAAQTQAHNWAQGVAGGSLDYQAAQAQLARANYERAALTLANYERAQQTLADLERYRSDPDDIARQKDAIARIREDLDSGDAQQQEVYNEFKAHWRPEVTAEERLIAEQARRAFEMQDAGNREAVLRDQALRGVRSGSSEIASALANQQRFGQDRTLAELGLQANAVQRAEANRANAGNMANSIRGANQQSLGLYVDATGQLRAMNDQVGMFNTDQANTQNRFNAGEANRISMFNADAYNQNQMHNSNAANQNAMFNATAYNQNQQFNAHQANQMSQFNVGQTNQARANNQSTRLAGGIQQGNMANQIRNANDAVNMFNSAQSMQHQQWQADALNNMSNQRLGNVTGTTNQMSGRTQSVFDGGRSTLDTMYGRDRDTTNDGIGLAGATHTIRSNTNKTEGERGQTNFNNLMTAYPTFITGATTSFGMKADEERQRKEREALEILKTKSPTGYRMA